MYQNDTSLDIKGEFKKLYNDGKDVTEITEKLINEYKSIMEDSDEAALFWINEENNALKTKNISPQAMKQWEETLNNLKNKLNLQQPEKRKISKKRSYKCQWKIGDVFAYQLESDLAKERGLYGRYLLIQKVDEAVWYPEHIVPIAYIKITDDENIPSNIEEYNKLKYVQTDFSKYEERFWTIVNILSVAWKEFEKRMIERYCGHNLRELSVYTDKK